MVSQRIPLRTGYIYHIFNRGTRKSSIFSSKKDHQRWENLLFWCQTYDYSYSVYLHRIKQTKTDKKTRQEILAEIDSIKRFRQKPVDILAHAEMDNHYHLLVKQTDEEGILKFIHKLQTSYSKYFNLLHNFKGSLFESKYKAVLVNTDEQFLQLFRYIHLNPLSAGLVHRDNLLDYPWSSLAAYMGMDKEPFLSKEKYLEMFNNDKRKLWNFVIDSIGGREIDSISGLTHDDDFGWYEKEKEGRELLKRELIEESLKKAS